LNNTPTERIRRRLFKGAAATGRLNQTRGVGWMLRSISQQREPRRQPSAARYE